MFVLIKIKPIEKYFVEDDKNDKKNYPLHLNWMDKHRKTLSIRAIDAGFEQEEKKDTRFSENITNLMVEWRCSNQTTIKMRYKMFMLPFIQFLALDFSPRRRCNANRK